MYNNLVSFNMHKPKTDALLYPSSLLKDKVVTEDPRVNGTSAKTKNRDDFISGLPPETRKRDGSQWALLGLSQKPVDVRLLCQRRAPVTD